MRYVLAGASGFLGSALRVRLASAGHTVHRLVRREPATATEFRWDPDTGQLDPAVLAGAGAVVNLCGVGIADRPWTSGRRELLRSSRVNPTRTLAEALAGQADPRPALIQASGIGVYGTRPTSVPHTEDSPAADDFIGQLVTAWEGAAEPAMAAGVRTAFLRTSPVLDRSGGAFRLMKRAWSLGLAAKLGSGRQRMPLITLEDYLRAVTWVAEQPEAHGPYNLTIPEVTTNAEFTDVLAEELHRPSLFRAPAPVLRAALGELAEQLVGDIWAVPERLRAQGFDFVAPDVRTAVALAIGPR